MINIPLIILIIFASIGLGIDIALHNKPKTGKYSAWIGLFGLIIQIALTIWAISWGF